MALRSPDIIYNSKDRLWSVGVVVVLLLVVSWSVILSGNLSGRGAADDLNYHWLVIQQFSEQLPNPDLSDYQSATTPGYHLILSPLVQMDVGHMGVQLVASVWTIGFLGLLTWVVSARFGKLSAVLMLPMLTSMYVLYPGIWLLPDNAGWFGVLAIVLLSLRSNPTWKSWAVSGVILFGLIWMRQIHIWIAGTIWLGAWLGSAADTPTLRTLFSSCIDRTGRTTLAIACTIPAFTVLVWFMILWGGLVPPTFQENHQGPNMATPGFILLQLSILSLFFAPMLWPRFKETWKHQWGWIVFAAFIGCLLGVVPESSYSYEAGRYGGWWGLIHKLPTVAGRSPIFILGSILGAVVFVVWLNLVTRRDAWIWVGTMVAFTLAQSANHASWQRYHEPMLFIMLLLILARSSVVARYTRQLVIGCLAMALMLGALTVGEMINAQPVETKIQSHIEP
ncbi:MAG: hypothetical protein JKX70_11000 [Phycisphaerales bacterium]|nr:hypothetical protein [Phycisphaerales bacterium]